MNSSRTSTSKARMTHPNKKPAILMVIIEIQVSSFLTVSEHAFLEVLRYTICLGLLL